MGIVFFEKEAQKNPLSISACFIHALIQVRCEASKAEDIVTYFKALATKQMA